MRNGRQELFILKSRYTFNYQLPSKYICAISVFIVLILSSSCGQNRATERAGRVFTDEFGREVRLEKVPERIVSLAPSVTENLFALGLGDRVVGVTTYCDYPPEAAQKERVGDTLRPSVERIVALRTELAIISTSSQLEDYVRKLESAGVPVYISNPRNVEEVLTSIEHIGEITGAQSAARDLVSTLRNRIDAVERRVSSLGRTRVLLILGSQPLITAGGNSFINDLIERAGGQSISADEKADYPQYSLETALARQPEVIFMQAGEDKLPERLKETPAARNGRIYHLDDALILRPGPRVVDGLELMASKIHP